MPQRSPSASLRTYLSNNPPHYTMHMTPRLLPSNPLRTKASITLRFRDGCCLTQHERSLLHLGRRRASRRQKWSKLLRIHFRTQRKPGEHLERRAKRLASHRNLPIKSALALRIPSQPCSRVSSCLSPFSIPSIYVDPRRFGIRMKPETSRCWTCPTSRR